MILQAIFTMFVDFQNCLQEFRERQHVSKEMRVPGVDE